MHVSRLKTAFAASCCIVLSSCTTSPTTKPDGTIVSAQAELALPETAVTEFGMAGSASIDHRAKETLARAIAGKDIVALGEQTHGDGAAFKIRAAMIRYLVEEQGFDAILFEAGMFDVMYGARVLAKTGDGDYFSEALWDFWGNATQNADLHNLILQRLKAGSPLALGGFDARLMSGYAPGYAPTVSMFVAKADPVLAADPEFSTYIDAMEKASKTSLPKLSAKEQAIVADVSPRVQTALQTIDPYLAQVVKTTDACAILYSRELASDSPDLAVLSDERDRLMADNLSWLLEGPFKGKKVILVGATYHFIRNQESIVRTPEFPLPIESVAIMGDLLRERYGQRMFTLGFSSAEGEYGHQGDWVEAISEPSAGSLERSLLDSGSSLCLVDLARARSSLGGRPMSARLFTYDDSATCADWSGVLDMLCFLRTMEPVRYE